MLVSSKRFIDVMLASWALLVLSPLLLGLMVVLRFTGEGEVFYRQTRVGQGGRRFDLLKFATMLKNSPQLGTGLLTTRDDPRVLPVGRFLRRTKLNELPQLLNIWLGDMSVIGPRPQTPEHVAMFPDDLGPVVLAVRPGLSGIGSIVFRDEELLLSRSPKGPARCFAEDITPYKTALEAWYVENRSTWLDLQLVCLTLLAVANPSARRHWRVLPKLPKPPHTLRELGVGPHNQIDEE